MSFAAASALLRLADASLNAGSLPISLSVRACSVLTRQGLEIALKTRLGAENHGKELTSMRGQLLCLFILDEQSGERAAHLWSALSRACHQHPYELSPLPGEVAALIADTRELIDSLAAGTRG